MKAGLWNSLEVLSTQAALIIEWEQELGAEFSAARLFLRPTQHQAGSYPCVRENSCGCRHRVIFDSPDDVSAVCDCDEAGCEPITLKVTDLIIYSVDGGMLATAICQAFQFDESERVAPEEVRSRLVGRWGMRRSQCFFYVPISETGFLKEIDRLCAATPDPFILLTPTSRFCTPMVQRALRREGCAQMALAGIVALASPGVLELIPAVRPAVDAVLGDFGKRIAQGKPLELAIARVEEKLNAIAKNGSLEGNEAVSEDVARQAFAMVKQLDSGQRMKEPSLVTVFRLYCIRELSAAQIAAQFACSKTAIMKRLKILADRTGMPPARLRKYSAQFERMEDELGDWRARRINRHELANGPDPEEKEMD